MTFLLTALLLAQTPPPAFHSKLAIFDMKTRTSTVIYEQDGILEAPNWSRDGSHLLVNTGGNLYRIAPTAGAKLDKLALGDGTYRCNNDHDYSPDGTLIAFSASSPSSRQSQVYLANADGTNIRLVTPNAPSYFHGWSPDGKWLAYAAQRNGKWILHRISASGGEEQQLTFAGAYDDGPEYSRDGKWIYFNTNRGGGWAIWRIPADGGGPNDSKAERITNDELEDWFPHFSPNAKEMIFLSFPAGTEGHNGRMPGMKLRRLKGKKIETLVTFPGGQGTINVNSWSPDSKRFAYVMYEPLARP